MNETAVPAEVTATERIRRLRARVDAELDDHGRELRALMLELGRVVLEPAPDAAPARPRRLPSRPIRRSAAVAATFLIAVLSLLFVRVGYVTSGSMAPSIPVGSLVVSVAVPAGHVHTGDVITFTRPGHEGVRITHRVVRTERRDGRLTFVTKGDANSAPDDWFVPATGRMWKNAVAVPSLGRGLAFLGQPLPRLFLVLAPLYLLAGFFLARLWRSELAARRAERAYF